jgi:hypothetical protein
VTPNPDIGAEVASQVSIAIFIIPGAAPRHERLDRLTRWDRPAFANRSVETDNNRESSVPGHVHLAKIYEILS